MNMSRRRIYLHPQPVPIIVTTFGGPDIADLGHTIVATTV
jgi:hypothetical protein